MIELVVQIKAPMEQTIGVKEQICMELEKFGDVKVVSVREVARRGWQQQKIEGWG